MGQQVIVIGAVVLGVGIILALLEHAGLPRLPGDILVRKEGFTFYAPFGTMLLISIVLTVLLNLLRR